MLHAPIMIPNLASHRVTCGRWVALPDGFRHAPPAGSGRGLLRLTFEGGGARHVRFAVTVTPRSEDAFCIRMGESRCELPFAFTVGPRAEGARITCEEDNWTRAVDRDIRAEPGKPCRIELVGEPGTIAFHVNGRRVGFVDRDARRSYRGAELFACGPSDWTGIEIEMEGIQPSASRSRARKFLVSSSVDFCHGDTPDPRWDRLDEFMQLLARTGVERVNWIIQSWPPDEKQKEGVAAAHRAGMEFVAVLKWPEFGKTDRSSREANRTETALFGFDHPEAYARRAPLDESFARETTPVQMMEFIKDDDKPFDHTRLKLWVSDDGKRFEPYTGPGRVENVVETRRFERKWDRTLEPPRAVRVIRFEGVRIAARHFAVSCPPAARCDTFANRLHRLVSVTAEDGRKVWFQWGMRFGFDEKANRVVPSDEDLFAGSLWDNDVFGAAGPGWVSGPDRTEWQYSLDNPRGALAFRRHFEPVADRVWSPAVPVVREFFGGMVRRWLDWGADGIDLRITNHLRSMDWTDMHFNPEVAREYEKRHGTPLTRATVDREAHQVLMAEFYGQFVRDISSEVRRRGRTMIHHIHTDFDADAKTRGLLSMYWDWRAWIDAGWLDEIFLKEIVPGSEFFDEVTSHAKRRGLPCRLSRSINGLLGSDPDYAPILEGYIREAREAGLDGYDLYDGRHLIGANASGQCELSKPGVTEAIRNAMAG